MQKNLFVVPAVRIDGSCRAHGERPGLGINGDFFQHSRLRIAVSQERVQYATYFIRVDKTAPLGKNGIAEAVYDDSNGNAGQINGLTRFPVLVTPHGQGKAVFLFESRDLFSRVFVFLTQGDKGNPVAVFFIGFVQIRKFMIARSAPGRPEIDQHGFVVFQRLAQGERIPLCVRHGEIRERLPKK